MLTHTAYRAVKENALTSLWSVTYVSLVCLIVFVRMFLCDPMCEINESKACAIEPQLIHHSHTLHSYDFMSNNILYSSPYYKLHIHKYLSSVWPRPRTVLTWFVKLTINDPAFLFR